MAVITGASRGIGLAVARELAAQGCDLVLAGRQLASLEKAGRELTRTGVRVLVKVCDVRDPESVEALAARVKKQFGRVDVLVNNAGIAHASLPMEKLSCDDWKDVIETNLTGMFLVTRAILPLTRRGGTVVNNLSIAAKRVFRGWSAYAASKHGALGLTNTLREELRPRGIRVIALLPGATDTDIWGVSWAEAPREKMMSAATVARAAVDAILLPANSTVEEVTIMPTVGAL
ncbi:MAG TPA: SDR family NAD(P)-dependent oxidoreductase [Terriglobales bacterium]|nr:SDR family NAD(P)-dependent oxidoreductase [Terriglobales bacterium]